MRAFVRATSGMLNIWDGADPHATPGVVHLSGLCGEIMSTHYPHTGDVLTIPQLEHRFQYGWRLGEVGLMRADVHAELQRLAFDDLLDDPTGRASPRDLIDVFFLRNRLRRWTGTEHEVDATNRVFPLYSLVGVRAGFAIGAARRREMFLHRRVVESISPELAAWRFAGPGWPETMPEDGAPPARRRRRAGHALGAVPARRAAAAPGENEVTANQDHNRRTLDATRHLLDEQLRDDPDHRVFDVIDRVRTLEALDQLERLDLQDRIRLFGAATAAMWLGTRDP